MKRKTFVGLTAGVAAAGASGAAEIESQHVQLDRPGGSIDAYAAAPRSPRAVAGGVVVTMHIWGVDTTIREVVDRLAQAGYAAIAPNLYARMHAPIGDGLTDYTQFVDYAKKLDDAQTDGDLRAGALWIKHAHPHAKVGVMGFCMGGTIALRQAIRNADVFAADSVFYGKVAGTDPAAVHMPFMGSYGADDRSIPVDGVHAFAEGLHVPHDVKVYPGAGHAFMDDHRASYVPAAAHDAWQRLMRFWPAYLT